MSLRCNVKATLAEFARQSERAYRASIALFLAREATMGISMRSRMAGPGVRIFTCIVFCLATAFAPAVHAQNFSDIWWNPNESGWGLTLVDHQTQLAGVWYTYTPAGRPVWYVMPAASFTQGKRFVTLDIYQSTGPGYNVAFNPSQVVQTKVGTASFDFAPPGLASGVATFSYTLGSVSQTKQVQRTPFGNAAPVWGTDYTDILWNANEPGWGLALAQHGSSIGGVWYTYGTDGQPLWVLMPAVSFTSPTSFSGPLYTATGPAFSSVPFDASKVHLSLAGDASISFTETGLKIIGGTFVPTLNNFTQFEAITFLPFGTAREAASPPPPSDNSDCSTFYVPGRVLTIDISTSIPGIPTHMSTIVRSFGADTTFLGQSVQQVIEQHVTDTPTVTTSIYIQGLSTEWILLGLTSTWSVGSSTGSSTVTYQPAVHTAKQWAIGQTGTYSGQLIIDGHPTLNTTVQSTTTFARRESVAVPAGTFDACLFHTDSTSSNVAGTAQSSSDTWIAQNVGEVKTVNTSGTSTLTSVLRQVQ
jgi:hypothetical protein